MVRDCPTVIFDTSLIPPRTTGERLPPDGLQVPESGPPEAQPETNTSQSALAPKMFRQFWIAADCA